MVIPGYGTLQSTGFHDPQPPTIATLDRVADTTVSAPNPEDYFEAPLAEIERFDKKVTKQSAHRRNLANKYPRTELAKMHDQIDKYYKNKS